MKIRISEFERARGLKLCAKHLSEIRRASPSTFEIVEDHRPDLPLITVRAMTGTGHVAEMMVDPLRLVSRSGVTMPPPDVPGAGMGWG
jgi:hypothetical protein